MYLTKTATWQFFCKKIQTICQIIAYDVQNVPLPWIVNRYWEIDQYFTLRKRICHGEWHDGKRKDCEGNHSHFANNTNMPAIKEACLLYSLHHIFYMRLTPLRTPKIVDLETTIFELNMMVKSGLVFLFWNFTSWPVQKSCPERLNWPFRLAGNSEGASRISK